MGRARKILGGAEAHGGVEGKAGNPGSGLSSATDLLLTTSHRPCPAWSCFPNCIMISQGLGDDPWEMGVRPSQPYLQTVDPDAWGRMLFLGT